MTRPDTTGVGPALAGAGRDGALADLLAEALTDVRGEPVRVDTKAGTLLSLASAALALLTALTSGAHLPTPVTVPVWAATAAFGAAVAVLLATVNPHTGPAPHPDRSGPAAAASLTSWMAYAHAADLHASLADLATAGASRWRADRLTELSRITARKFSRLRTATRLLTAGLGLLTLAAALSAFSR
ncbi:MAG TPA: Pycsar system effector family protein [Mycobacteriales bacterium]|nr:Pycsar system effector family protein [Mycobacteriales bacterium]